MSRPVQHDEDERVAVGTGEFQLREAHVVARVEVQEGSVRKIEFTTAEGVDSGLADSISSALEGKPLSAALEVKAKAVDGDQLHRGENTGKVALLEAFHRAVESCFDSE